LYLFRLLLFTLLGLFVQAAVAAPLRVSMLMVDEVAAYREFSEAFAVEAAKKNLNITVSSTSNLALEADLIIAVGAKSLALAASGRSPVLAVLVSKVSFEKTLQEAGSPQNKKLISAIFLDQPSKRQLNLIAVVLPEVKKVGVMYSSVSTEILNLRKAILSTRFSLVESQVSSGEILHRQLSSLLEESDVLLSIPDVQIYNPTTMRNILLDAYQKKIPLIGISPSYVRAGALCAVFTKPEQFAAQAVAIAQQYLNEGSLPSPQYPTHFDVQLNQQVARSLNILLKDNFAIHKQMKALEAEGGGK